MAEDGEQHDVKDLMGFIAQEMQLFFAHISTSVAQFSETSKLPHSLFKAKEVKKVEKKTEKAAAASAAASEKAAAKAKKPRAPRKPSAYNLFIKEKIEELKAQGFEAKEGPGHKALFGAAVAGWKELSAEEKKAFAEKHNLAHGEEPTPVKSGPPSDDAEEAEAEPELEASPAPAEGTEQKKKKKKKKHDAEGEEPKKKKKKHHHKEADE